MNKAQQDYIEWFRRKGIDYWLFSKTHEARTARAMGDVPIEMVEGVTATQANEICANIRKRLDDPCFNHANYDAIYVKLLVRFNDTSALDRLIEWKEHFEERHRRQIPPGCDWSTEIRLLEDAITHLKRIR